MSDNKNEYMLQVEVDVVGPHMEVEVGGVWQTGAVEVQAREIKASGFNLVVDAHLPEQVEVVILKIIRVKK